MLNPKALIICEYDRDINHEYDLLDEVKSNPFAIKKSNNKLASYSTTFITSPIIVVYHIRKKRKKLIQYICKLDTNIINKIYNYQLLKINHQHLN